MKKTYKIKALFSFLELLFFICLFLFNTSCGLDAYEVLTAKPVARNVVNDTSEFDNRTFSFITDENVAPMIFDGTDVYYKIYNSAENAKKESDYLTNMSSNENHNDFDTMTGTYGYNRLYAQNYNSAYLIPPSGSGNSQTVEIRLTDYNNDSSYCAKITVNGNNLGGGEKKVPLRVKEVSDVERSFNFDSTVENGLNQLPVKGEKDVSFSDSEGSDIWYVVLYAVEIVHNSSFTYQNSNIEYLGTVKINATNKNN